MHITSKHADDELHLDFPIPVFFHFEYFRKYDLKIAYLLGIGIDRDQLESMLIDFALIYITSMYILHFRNPVLMKRMTKVFWQFPSLDNLD